MALHILIELKKAAAQIESQGIAPKVPLGHHELPWLHAVQSENEGQGSTGN